jgi:hypothetical protein
MVSEASDLYDLEKIVLSAGPHNAEACESPQQLHKTSLNSHGVSTFLVSLALGPAGTPFFMFWTLVHSKTWGFLMLRL